MTPTTGNWKSPLALFIAVLALYLASFRIDVQRRAEAKPQAPITAPSANPAQDKPISNDIDEFQQLG
ncbi:MAG TPA: hypothetical protein VFA79_18555 [Myxococcales bacterium]|nr:hypothetical protein [Myxococcales bacterium]